MSNENTDTPDVLPMWVVYYNPEDFPGKYVVRVHELRPDGLKPLSEAWIGDTLAEARASIPPGLVRIPRVEEDFRSIVETWL